MDHALHRVHLVAGFSRAAPLMEVEKLAWDALKCLHMEVSDPYFVVDDGRRLGFDCGSFVTYRSDLRRSEEELLTACRAPAGVAFEKQSKHGRLCR